MNPAISFITIGVNDLQKMKSFYKDVLGWQTTKDEEGIAFFKMNEGLIFSLFPENELAKDIGIINTSSEYKNFSLAINLPTQKEVDDFFQMLIEKNVTIQKMPELVLWGGYRGYFADPENNFWEVAYNPFL
ncbi:VOC family protein [Arachidicoccus soli]|uniref:VOC family protein n=1 Tax=Arachidicoccus soli TaxID=2341117 RepID=A0A386HNE1_9BACT|nr:VOC family protein [Arachidicoccus soli]AYD47030.1 VOC family protein [Arachidicoccus soli]